MAHRTLRIVLFVRGTTLDTALRLNAPGREVTLRSDLGFEAKAYLVDVRAGRPGWLDYLSGGTEGDLPDLTNQSNGSIILVRVDRDGGPRVLAFTFGNGRTLLELDRIEHDFGLRVVVNSVNPDRLRRVETKVFEDLVLHTARQASRQSPTVTFSIDDSRDLVRAVAGEPRDRGFARRIAGSDSLAMSSEAEFGDLGDLSADLLDFYESDTFREDFGFIEQIRPVRDTVVLAELDAELEMMITAGQIADLKVHLAPPEIIDYDVVDGFMYPGESRGRDDPHADLDVAEFLLSVGRENATVANLRRFRVRAVDRDGGEFDVWPAYNCLVVETRHAGRLFMLSEGQWFEVHADFAAQVDGDVAAVGRLDLAWPDGLPG